MTIFEATELPEGSVEGVAVVTMTVKRVTTPDGEGMVAETTLGDSVTVTDAIKMCLLLTQCIDALTDKVASDLAEWAVTGDMVESVRRASVITDFLAHLKGAAK
jgi:hypothetical protein